MEEAPDGHAALEAATARPPMLVLLDIDMPGMSGLEVMTQLRRDEPDLPVVIVSAHTAELDRVLGLEFGADDYVTKPFSPRELAARVRSVLRRSGRSRPSDDASNPGPSVQSLRSGDLVTLEQLLSTD